MASAGTAASVDCASYNTSTGALLTGNTDQEGLANPVSGARHVLKLVDGWHERGRGELPARYASRQRMLAERSQSYGLRRIHGRI